MLPKKFVVISENPNSPSKLCTALTLFLLETDMSFKNSRKVGLFSDAFKSSVNSSYIGSKAFARTAVTYNDTAYFPATPWTVTGI